MVKFSDLLLLGACCFFICGCDIPDTNYMAKAKQELSSRRSFLKKSSFKVPPALYAPLDWVNIGTSSSLVDSVLQISEQVNANVNFDSKLTDRHIQYKDENITFIEFIRNICVMSGWMFRIAQNGKIFISNDEPYTHVHKAPFVSSVRNVFVDSSIKQAVGNDSKIKMSSANSIDLWGEILSNIAIIVGEKGVVSINKQAGLIILHTTQKKHAEVALILDEIRKRCMVQIDIQAKIVAVELADGSQNGVDWNLGRAVGKQGSATNAVGSLFLEQKFNETIKNRISFCQTITEGITLLSQYGNIESLLNPRLRISNNESAFLEARDHVVYFKVQKKMQPGITNTYWNQNRPNSEELTNIDYEIIPVGISFFIQGSADPDTGKISLLIKPSISSVGDKVYKDPMNSEIPQIKQKSVDTTVVVNSGEVIMLGGLIDNKTLPGTLGIRSGRVCLTGKSALRTEFVIIIKASIAQVPIKNLSEINSVADLEICPYIERPLKETNRKVYRKNRCFNEASIYNASSNESSLHQISAKHHNKVIKHNLHSYVKTNFKHINDKLIKDK